MNTNIDTMNWESITICGGGNGAHTLLALLLKHSNSRLTLYVPLEQELQSFQTVKNEKTPFTLIVKDKKFSIPLERLCITSDPKEGAAADLIMIVTPAFAHQDILTAFAPYLQAGTVVAALPARGGLDFQASDILRKHRKEGIIIAGFQTLPWACRIKEYAKSVEIFGQKSRVGVASLPSHYSDRLARGFQKLLKLEFLPYHNMLEITLDNKGQIIHPGIMYGAFFDKLDQYYQKEKIPLFYQDVDEHTADLLNTMSREIITIRDALEENFNLNLQAVSSLFQWMLESYGADIQDTSTLSRMFQSNRSYQNLRVPVKSVQGFYQIDVRSRYLTEDIPYGLLVSKAIAELAGVSTLTIDEVIHATSKRLGVQYLINGKLQGKDLGQTRIPQNFGLESVKAIVELL
jgi:hypothetical protein